MRIPLALLVCTVGALGQDLLPSLRRAAAAVVGDLSAELPWSVPKARALVVVAADRGSSEAAALVLRGLERNGFSVAESLDGADHFVVTAAVEGDRGRKRLSVEVPGAALRYVRRFGDADWVDEKGAHRVIVGPGRPNEAEATSAAEAELRHALEKAYPSLAASSSGRRGLGLEPAAVFVASEGDGANRAFRTYLKAPSENGLAAREARYVLSASRANRIKFAASAAVAIALFGAFRFADWRTRGWRVRKLRLAFSTIFAAAMFALWGAA